MNEINEGNIQEANSGMKLMEELDKGTLLLPV